jgi:lysophospholipase L1-like esterase
MTDYRLSWMVWSRKVCWAWQTRNESMSKFGRLVAGCFLLMHGSLPVSADDGIVADLTVPAVTDAAPSPGARVRQFNKDYVGSKVYHTLYLPTDWKPNQKYPVIVEYAGNQWRTSLGTVEGSSLGYGVTGGKGVIWICMPYVNQQEMRNQETWWGDVDATVAYCKHTVKRICNEYGGDSNNVFIAGFSRGAIAGNFIGLHDDEIASLWRGFICHSHYDGVRQWGYPNSDRPAAAERLARLGNRPQFISQENSTEATQTYLKEAHPTGNFTFVPLKGVPHTDTWVLEDRPERATFRDWFNKSLVTDVEVATSKVVNAGVGGNRSSALLTRLEKDVLSHKPTVVVLMVGTNDRLNSGGFVDAKSYRKNVETLVDRIRQGSAKVLLVTPPPCIPELLFTRHDPQKFADQSPEERMAEVRSILLDISKEQDVPLVDFHEHLLREKIADNQTGSVIRNVANSGMKDGVHLTPRGYELLARLIAEKIKTAELPTSKVVCFGDSLTKGSAKANYPAYLDAILNRRENDNNIQP